ncbi:MAG: hypothetical protein WEA34_03555 [Gemmatimonadota bacterium]
MTIRVLVVVGLNGFHTIDLDSTDFDAFRAAVTSAGAGGVSSGSSR